MMLTAERLREVLDYDPKTGIFTRKLARGNDHLIGKPTSQVPRKNGYLTIRVDGVMYYAHRLAWLHVHGVWPIAQGEHENTIKTDNRIDNIRDANPSQNRANIHAHKNSATGVKGVSWDRKSKKFRAQISKDGEKIHLGHFDDIGGGAGAYAEAANRLFGEFART
jgi:hypothetical protein